MSDTSQDIEILDLASKLVRDGLEDGDDVLATRAVLLVEYVAADGQTYDSYFMAGDPRFTTLFGMIESFRIRVQAWMSDRIIYDLHEEKDTEE